MNGIMAKRLRSLLFCLAVAAPGLSAWANVQLALEKGCLGCHGEPPRRGVPGMAELAARFERYRAQPEAPRQLAEKLRAGSLFGHIASHERISQHECEALMRWIIDGAP
jgi:cytochrome c